LRNEVLEDWNSTWKQLETTMFMKLTRIHFDSNCENVAMWYYTFRTVYRYGAKWRFFNANDMVWNGDRLILAMCYVKESFFCTTKSNISSSCLVIRSESHRGLKQLRDVMSIKRLKKLF
jgi:hypothetical protein